MEGDVHLERHTDVHLGMYTWGRIHLEMYTCMADIHLEDAHLEIYTMRADRPLGIYTLGQIYTWDTRMGRRYTWRYIFGVQACNWSYTLGGQVYNWRSTPGGGHTPGDTHLEGIYTLGDMHMGGGGGGYTPLTPG